MHRNFGAEARLARDGLDLHDAGLNLRHFQLKESLDEAGMRAADQNLRSFAVLTHFEHIDLDAVVVLIGFAGNHLVRGQDTVRFAELDIDVALLHALHDRREHFVLFFDVFFVDHAALRLADALHDNLLGCLRRNTRKLFGFDFFFQHIAYFVEHVNLLCIGK